MLLTSRLMWHPTLESGMDELCGSYYFLREYLAHDTSVLILIAYLVIDYQRYAGRVT